MSGEVPSTIAFIGKVVNSLVLFGGLFLVARKPIKALLAKKTAEVGETLRLAASSRDEAQAKAASSKAKVAGLADEVRTLKAAAEEQGRREAERIARAAAQEAERLKKLTRQELEEQVRRSVVELKSYAAVRAADLARERIRKRLTLGAQAALIDKSIDKLTGLHEKPGSR